MCLSQRAFNWGSIYQGKAPTMLDSTGCSFKRFQEDRLQQEDKHSSCQTESLAITLGLNEHDFICHYSSKSFLSPHVATVWIPDVGFCSARPGTSTHFLAESSTFIALEKEMNWQICNAIFSKEIAKKSNLHIYQAVTIFIIFSLCLKPCLTEERRIKGLNLQRPNKTSSVGFPDWSHHIRSYTTCYS